MYSKNIGDVKIIIMIVYSVLIYEENEEKKFDKSKHFI
jgi:hypothetical protein